MNDIFIYAGIIVGVEDGEFNCEFRDGFNCESRCDFSNGKITILKK